MRILEIALLILAYTSLVITLFVEIICYKKNLETIRTIAFSGSLLLLIVALSYVHFIEEESASANGFLLVSMTIVGLTTPLNVLEERRHNLNPLIANILMIVSAALCVLVIVAYFADQLEFIQYPVAIFLGISVTGSMLLILATKPLIRIAHRERIERVTSTLFLVVIPLILLLSYYVPLISENTRIGFTLPLVFIVLALSKIWDDVQRLSLFKEKHSVNEEYLKNYALTRREQEVARLLIEGLSYKLIAERLFISMPTVKTHASSIYKKCKVTNRIELITLLGH